MPIVAPMRSVTSAATSPVIDADTGNPPEVEPGGVRIESFGRDQPEARAEHRAEPRDLQIHDLRRQARRPFEQEPGAEEQRCADHEGRRHERAWGDGAQAA